MNAKTKNIIYSAILFTSVLVVYLYRKYQQPAAPVLEPVVVTGQTMGTTYRILYFDDENRDFKSSIDSLLGKFNKSLNTYLPDSEITTFNTSDTAFYFELPYFLPVLKQSQEISTATNGAFDPTVMPLVRAWGFGPGKSQTLNAQQVDSIKQFIGYNKIKFDDNHVWKEDSRIQLDFSAIAKGYGVDVVADFMSGKGMKNIFVEIGGEVVTKGKQLKHNARWTVAILDPRSTIEEQHSIAIAELENQALATSGNYFNYREINGKRISHTIDPATGYPVQRDILSASIFAKDCMTADAWATACMVMGYKSAIELLRKHPEVSAFLIYSAKDGAIETFISEGLEKQITLQPMKQ